MDDGKRRRENEWAAYINYLRGWADGHRSPMDYGTSPMSWSAYADKCGFGYAGLEEEQDEKTLHND